MTDLRRGIVALLTCLLASVSMGATVRVYGATVVVNEVPVLALKAEVGGMSPTHRAESIATELQALDGSESVLVAKDHGKYLLRVGDVVIDGLSGEAAARSMPSARLAHFWAAKLSYALGLPPLQVTVQSVRIGPGATQIVPVVGSQVAYSDVHVDDADVATAKRTDAGLALLGVKPGHTRATISAGMTTETVEVEVKSWAAAFPQTLEVNVTGAPATAQTVQGAIAGAMQTQLAISDGANLAYKLPQVEALEPGANRTISIWARASANDTLQSSGEVNVVVHNLGLPQRKDEALWYSNSPESVFRPGALFSSSLKLDSPARLLYHHYNASNTAMYIRVEAINDTDQASRLLVIPGDSKPDKNPVRAGLKAADQYVRAWMWGSGEVINLPPHSTLPISLRRLLPGETVSGLCSLRLVSGPPEIQVRTDAWPPFPVDRIWNDALWSSTPWRIVGTNPLNDYDRAPYEPSPHIYPDPYRDDALNYQVGGRFGVWRLGQKPLSSQDDSQKLEGNFGVIYKIHASITNPTKQAADVEVVFEASAGYSGALFILNGDYVVTPLLQPKDEARIGRFRLLAGARKEFEITTLPLSGGSYPATITIRPVQSGGNVAFR